MKYPFFKKSVIISVFALLAFSFAAFPQEKAPFTLTIVPDKSHQDQVAISRTKAYNPKLHFHVVLTNTSNSPKRLWNENCSQGNGKLSFVVTDASGAYTTINKKDAVVWEKFFPEWFVLTPKEKVVYDVYFLPDTWNGFPEFAKEQSRKKIKIRAFYALDEQTIYSPQYSVDIFRDQ